MWKHHMDFQEKLASLDGKDWQDFSLAFNNEVAK